MREKVVKTPEKALETLQWLCSKMERCRFDAERSLYRWGVDKSMYQSIIEKLEQDKFIDQERYTRAYASEKLNYAKWGPTKIRFGLRAKRIDKDLVTKVLAEIIDQEDLNETLHLELVKRYKKENKPGVNTYQLRTKLFRWAAAKGYDFNRISHEMNVIFKQNEDEYEDE